MNAAENMKLETLLPRILPQVIGCPRSMALDATQTIAMDFCRQTGVWRAVFQEIALAGDPEIALCLPKDAAIETIAGVWIGREKTDEYETGAGSVILRFAPRRDANARIEAILRPKRTALELPVGIVEEWGDALAFGALAKLKAMSGQKLEWSDPQGASVYYGLYGEEILKAKGRSMRARFGAGAAYANCGWQ